MVLRELASALGTLLLLPFRRQTMQLLALASVEPLTSLILVMFPLELLMLLSSVLSRALPVQTCRSSNLLQIMLFRPRLLTVCPIAGAMLPPRTTHWSALASPVLSAPVLTPSMGVSRWVMFVDFPILIGPLPIPR